MSKTLPPPVATRRRNRGQYLRLISAASLLGVFLYSAAHIYLTTFDSKPAIKLPIHAESTFARCRALDAIPPSPNYRERAVSDRYEGSPTTVVRNARILTGEEDMKQVVHGDILLHKGLIKRVGGHFSDEELFKAYGEDVLVINANGSWVTPGIVDMHSHLGDSPSPELDAAVDDNSHAGLILPWMRSVDGINTHDDSFLLSIAGGVTTSLILPGSGDAIGGQAFPIKLRSTTEKSTISMLLEPPYDLNTSVSHEHEPLRWRYMKHACGENPSNWYSGTRMDVAWAFREAYNKAKEIKIQQDEYCAKVLDGRWVTGKFPEDLQWEALVDVLRGKVKVNTHCYEAVDLTMLIGLSNEFKFPIAAVHHASEAYLVPDLLKKAYQKPPAVALFATNSRYKREAYRGSEFAPRILAENGLQVIMKSDHPVLNSRYLLYEAQQAHYYGLPANLALASVTTTPAKVMGMDHRIGFIKEGFDADLVIWDSHPLALGATPTQVFIDGILQLPNAHVSQKTKPFQDEPRVPKFDQEAAEAVKWDGLPPLAPRRKNDVVFFTGVKEVHTRGAKGQIQSILSVKDTRDAELGVVIVQNGSIVCSGIRAACMTSMHAFQEVSDRDIPVIDLKGGSITPGLTSFGSPLGLEEIQSERTTQDGPVYDPLTGSVPSILGGDNAIIAAVDGLEFATRDAYLAYRSGVTSAIVFPSHKSFYSGLGTFFSTGAAHKLQAGAVIQDKVGMHVSVRHWGKKGPSVSTQIAVLRKLLLDPKNVGGEAGEVWAEVAEGTRRLVVEAHSADIIATLIKLKQEVESVRRAKLELTITGAAEAHLLAHELAQAHVGVVLAPSRPFPYVWEDRRILPGPPLTKESAITTLMKANVTVGIGIEEVWSARNARFDVAWASLESDGWMTKAQALAIASSNLELLLGADVSTQASTDLVATQGGGLFEMEAKVVGVLNERMGMTHLF